MAKVVAVEVSDDKASKIKELKKAMEKKFGAGIVMGASQKPQFHEFISTGSLGLDKALGIGGLPKGKITEIMGWESSGKTTMAIHTIAEAHKKEGAWAMFVDVEHAFDVKYAQALGVDLNRLEISQPSYGEEALEIVDNAVSSGLFDVVVLDSIAALVPKAEVNGEMGAVTIGLQSRLMSQAMRKLTPLVSNSGTLLILINQKREKIGVMFGSPETTPGGNAVKFYASVRMDVSRSVTKENTVMDGEEKVGNLVKVKVIKNKTAPPFRVCEFDVLYGEGIDKYGELLEMAISVGMVTKSGAFFSYNGEILGQGRVKALETIRTGKVGEVSLYEKMKREVIEGYVPKEFVPTAEEAQQA